MVGGLGSFWEEYVYAWVYYIVTLFGFFSEDMFNTHL
jgi:hypothetical protein